ncbi:MAG: hypothetical protein M1823_000957 [Watsoniomyces obsoletus]|nr:MAG: hypothetical protein M1823_000957 [Watsoniomyces obsoletus]
MADRASRFFTPEAGILAVGSSALTAGVLRFLQGRENKKLEIEAERRGKTFGINLMTQIAEMRQCYMDEIITTSITTGDFYDCCTLLTVTENQQAYLKERDLRRNLRERELLEIWNECRKKFGLDGEELYDWYYHNPRGRGTERARQEEKQARNYFKLEEVAKATQPLMVDLGRQAQRFPGHIQRTVPMAMKMAANRIPAGMKLVGVP